MLFILFVKASKAGNHPSEALEEAMSQYNDALVTAGIRIMAKGLYPSDNGLRISFPNPGEAPVVTNGPFDSDDLIAGFILIDVKSREEAVRWAMRMPDPLGHGEGEIELRQIFEG